MNHTEECQRENDKTRKACDDWAARWLDHCRTCEGWRQFGYHATWEEPAFSEPCDDCTGQGRCARCQQQGLDSDTMAGPCTHCGWNYDDGLPSLPECRGECIALERFQ